MWRVDWSMRSDGSVMTSLAELRMLQEQRVANERSARSALEAATRAANERAARELACAEAQQVADDRARVLAIEQARATVERQARMRAIAVEAAERARHAALLDEQRLAQEMELRRVEALRTRPTWMVAVTATAILAAAALTVFAVHSIHSEREAKAVSARAMQEKDKAKQESAEHYRALAALDTRSKEMDEQLLAANRSLTTNETTAAALAAQRTKIAKLEAAKKALDAAHAVAAAKWAKDRADGANMSEDCLHNVISKKACK